MSIPNPYTSAGVVIPTTTTTTCAPTYVSITLNQGNSFVLPPGATLVGVSDKDKVQSDCFDVNTLEEYSCYIFHYNVMDDDNGVPRDPSEQVSILGLVIDGIFYEFSAPIVDNGETGGTDDTILLSGFLNGLNSISLDAVVIDVTVYTQDNGNVDTRIFCFKTIASIANKMQIKIKDTTSGVANPVYLLPLYTWSQIVAEGDISVDGGLQLVCSCSPDYVSTTTTTLAP